MQPVLGPRPLLCVPNISEGRNPEILQRITDAASGEGIRLLGSDSDPDHNRSVVTFAGTGKAVVAAALAIVRTALDLIDLRTHRGVHPRMGAVDVCPFVPLRGATMADAVRAAENLGAEIGLRLAVPVYLYGEAARRPERRNLAEIRRGGFEGLREAIGSDPSREPDFGPRAIHPTAGAIAVGARPFLIAYNVNLRCRDLKLAREIARSIRETSGGLPGVKALGLRLKGRGLVQVSTNVCDYRRASPAHVFERVRSQAAQAGVAVAGSEIVGFVPRDALAAMVENALLLEEPAGGRVIEDCLEEPSIDDYLGALSSREPAPGGGSASALAAAMAAALVSMVAAIRSRAAKDPGKAEALDALAESARTIMGEMRRRQADDERAYRAVVEALKLPGRTGKERALRQSRIAEAAGEAMEIPLLVMERGRETLALTRQALALGTGSTAPDLGIAADLIIAAVRGASRLVDANRELLPEEGLRQESKPRQDALVAEAEGLYGEITGRPWAPLPPAPPSS